MPRRRIILGKGWAIASCMLLPLFLLVPSTLFNIVEHNFQGSDATVTFIFIWGLACIAMFIYKPFRVPGAIACQIILLGLIVYRADKSIGGSIGVDGSSIADGGNVGFAAAPSFNDSSIMSAGDMPDSSMANPVMSVSDNDFVRLDNSGVANASGAFTVNDDGDGISEVDASTSNDSGAAGLGNSVTAAAGTIQSPIDTGTYASSTIYDNNGFAQGSVTQTGDNSYAFKDNMEMQSGSASVDSTTGNINVNDSTDMHEFTITNQGVIQGVDGLTEGHIVADGNGGYNIQDSQGATLGHIKDGVILDDKNQIIGRIKNN